MNAIQVSAFYGLLAVAYVLLYGITNRINLAFGGFAMWGGYLTVTAVTLLFALSPLGTVPTLLLAAGYALVGTGAVGFAVQHVIVRPLRREPSLAMLIATVGLALVLEESMRLANDSRERWLKPLLTDSVRLAGDSSFPIQVTHMQGLSVGISVALAAALVLFVARHRFGRLWRACSQDAGMAALCGINVDRVLALTFVIASAFAAVSGALIATYYGVVTFYMGTVLGLKALLAAVAGGLKSVGGAFLGALILGFLETFWAAYFSFEYRDVAVFTALVLILVFRPEGLFTRPQQQEVAAVGR